MVSSVLAQAILNQQAPDLVGSFEKGRDIARGEQSRKLQSKALRGDRSALDELRDIDPEVAMAIGESIRAQSASDIGEFVRDAKIGERMLRSGDVNSFLNFAEQRSQTLRNQGRDSSQTDSLIATVKAGGAEEALQQMAAFTGAVDKTVKLKRDETLFNERTGEVIARGQDSGDGISEEERFKRSGTILSEINSSTGDFQKVRAAYGKILASDITGIGDLALMQNFLKLQDPTSVIQPSELATVENAGGVPEKIRNFYNKAVRGEKLGDKVRRDLFNQSKKLFNSQKKLAQKSVNRTLSRGKRFGISKKDIFGDLDFFNPNFDQQFEELMQREGLNIDQQQAQQQPGQQPVQQPDITGGPVQAAVTNAVRGLTQQADPVTAQQTDQPPTGEVLIEVPF